MLKFLAHRKTRRKTVLCLRAWVRFFQKLLVGAAALLCALAMIALRSVDYVYTQYVPPGGVPFHQEEVALKKRDDLGFYKKMMRDYELVKKINPDLAAWLDVPQVAYYPVMYSSKKDKYLHLDADGKTYKFAGCIFMDERSNGTFADTALLYGHHMMNGTMFAGLRKYGSEKFFQNNRPITVYDGNIFYSYRPYYVDVLPAAKISIQLEPYFDQRIRTETLAARAKTSKCAMKKGQKAPLSGPQLFLYTCEYGYNFTNPRRLVGAGCIRTFKLEKDRLVDVDVPVACLDQETGKGKRNNES